MTHMHAHGIACMHIADSSADYSKMYHNILFFMQLQVCILIQLVCFFYAAVFAGIAYLCVFVYALWVYLPHTAEMHRTGLPQKPDHFVNREQELEMIMESVTGSISHRSRIITVTGSPGYGKTTLANVCCHRFVSQGIPVRYVDLQDVCTIKGIVVKILYAVGSTVREPSMQQLSLWASQRQNGALVLVLDNVDCFTLSGDELKKKFSHLIKDFIVKPSLAIHVILTTQYHLSYIDSFKLVELDRLSETHAKELLLYRNPSLTANVTTTLAYFTDGNPLALQILSALLHMSNAPPIQTLLKEVHFDPVKALSPDSMHEKLNHVLKVAISYLSDEDRQCFLIVCQFPSSFDDASATVVLSHFVNESESTCLRHLQDRSLLEYNRNTQRYAVIPLLKVFVNSTSRQYREMASQFIPVYAKHLLHTAVMKQSLSEVHLQNYMKANFLGIQYLMNRYSLSNNALIFTNVDIILPFALSTFNILPLLQPVDVVEGFWFSVQKMTWNFMSKGFGGQCNEYLEEAIEFESLLADYMLNAHRNNTLGVTRLSRRAQSVQFDKLHLLVVSNCTKSITLLRYLGHLAKCSRDEGVYQNILKAIMKLASSKNNSTIDADYDIGVIYFDLNEYSLAVEFLNRSLMNNPGTQQLDAARTMVLSLQRNGQYKLAVDTVAWLVPYLLEQVNLDIYNATQHPQPLSVFLNHLETVDFDHYEDIVQNATEVLSRITDRYFAIFDLPIAVNNTVLSWSLLQNASDVLLTALQNVNVVSSSPTIMHYKEFCHESNESSRDSLYQLIRKSMCLEIVESDNVTRHLQVLWHFELYRTRVICDYSKAFLKAILSAQYLLNITSESAEDKSELATRKCNSLLEFEQDIKKLHACKIFGTGSVECQMSRSQVRLLWQMQYELAEGLAVYFASFGVLEQAKKYTEIVIEKLPQSSVERKWKVMVDHKLNLARIELSLGNYWNAVYILRNCSLTIDKEMIENIYQGTQQSTMWQSYDVSLPESQFAVLVHNYVFNTSKLLAAVVSGTVRLISQTGDVITGSHLLFAAIVALLWLLVFMTILILGSTLYCVQFICLCCSNKHNCLSKITLYLFDIITVMFAFSHVVLFYAYALHFHTSILLTYLNYI